MKIKESEQIDKHLELARKLRKMWNMKCTVIPIESGADDILLRDLEITLKELKIRGRIKTMQTTGLL